MLEITVNLVNKITSKRNEMSPYYFLNPCYYVLLFLFFLPRNLELTYKINQI